MTFATHVRPKTVQRLSLPRPARNAPSATAVSAGSGGMMFSSAASAVIRPYSGPGGRPSRNARRSLRGGGSEEHTSELQSLAYLVCRLLLEKKKTSLRY